MIMHSTKLFRNRSSCELMQNIRRGISKMFKNNNIDSVSRTQDHKMQHGNFNCNNNVNYKSWMKEMQQNNIRSLSTIQQTLIEPSQSNILVLEKQFKDFMAVFPDIMKNLIDDGISQELPDVMRRYAKLLQYNTPVEKDFGGMTLISSYILLEDRQKLTSENLRLASILGWCLEMSLAYLMINDDIFDYSETRRGKLCWHRQPSIGLCAINDALFLENAIYILLRKYFKDHPEYAILMELFNDLIYKTTLGQNLDVMFMDSNGKPNLEMFTMDRYATLVDYKTTCSLFQPPVALAMHLVGSYDQKHHMQAKTILLKLGYFVQAQNDFLDCYGDPAVTGKIGTDIPVGKCTWLAVTALEKASPAQRKIMQENYGRSEQECVANIRRLYEDLCIPNMFAVYKEEINNMMKTHIQQNLKGLRHDVFYKIVKIFLK